MIEQVLFELWDCLKGKVHTDMFSFVYALELIHNETVIQHYLYFCLEAHLKLIELMECSCEKYRTTTNHDFLVASLKFFYKEIPKRLLESYTRTIVQIFNLSWSPGDHPLTVECRELIQTHHLKMLSALREDEETRARLTTQLYNAGLANLLRGEQDVFKTVERVLTLPEAPPPTQLTQLKIAKKMYSETHPTLSNDLLLLFSKRCLMFHLYQDGVEWLDIVLQHKHPFHQNHKDEIVAILTLLKEEKTSHFLLPRLFQCIELFDDLNPLAHFLSDNFIRNHPDKILTILEMEKASSLERDTIFLILKCLGNELVISSMAEDAVWIRFFKLIVHFKIQLNDSWLGLCYRLRTVKSKRSIAQCVQLFRSAVTDNLIEEGSKRANCFNNLTHEWCRTSESFAITCLQSIPFLQTVYWIPEQKIIDPMVFKYLTIVLNQFVDKSLPFKGNALLEIYQTVYGLPRCSVGNIYLWYFDLTFLRAVKEHLTLEIFDCIKDRLMERLNDLQTINSDDKYIHNAIAQFFLLQLQDLQHAEHLHASFDLFVHQFGDQFWFVVSMLQAMLYVNPNPVIAFGNDSRTIYLQNQIENVLKRYLANTPELNVEHQTIFCINLNSLIGKRGKTHFRWIYRLLLMEETKQVVGADWKPLLETLAKTASTHTVIAADSEPNEDLFIPIEHTREYLDVFFPIDSSFDIDIQKTIWTNTVLTHTHQALLCELNKKSESNPYAFFTEICEYTYSSGVAGKCFYTNVRAFINTMLNILKSQKYASKLKLLCRFFHFLLVNESLQCFKGMREFANIVDDYIFGARSQMQYEASGLDPQLLKLFKSFDMFARANTDHPFFQDPKYFYLRGNKRPYHFAKRLIVGGRHTNIKILLHMIENANYYFENILIGQVVEIIASFLDMVINTNAITHKDQEMTLRFEVVLSKFMIKLLHSSESVHFAFAIALSSQICELRFTQFNQLLNDTVVLDADATLHATRKFITSMQTSVFITLFNVNPEKYWFYTRQAVDLLLDRVIEKKIPTLMLIEMGVIALHPEITADMSPSNKFYPEYSYIFQNLIHKRVGSLLAQGSTIIQKSLDIIQKFSQETEFKNSALLTSIINTFQNPDKPNNWLNL